MKKITQFFAWGGATTLTLIGAGVTIFYGVTSVNNRNRYKEDNRTDNEKIWDLRVNKNNFVYNNLFFPINGQGLSNKYVFLNSKRFDNQINKKALIEEGVIKPLNKSEDFEISFKNLDGTNILESLEKEIQTLNEKLISFKKTNPNKKLAIDFGKDLMQRKIAVRIWPLKNNISTEETKLIENFMFDLKNGSINDFRDDISKKKFLSFFDSESYFSGFLRQVVEFTDSEPKSENVSSSSSSNPEGNRNTSGLQFEDPNSKVFLERIDNIEEWKKDNNDVVDIFENSGFKNGTRYFKNLIDKKIIVTKKSFIDFQNQQIKVILFFQKLDEKSRVMKETTPYLIYVKNPSWIETREFDITNFVKEAVDKNNEMNNSETLNIEDFFIPKDNSNPDWKKMFNNPIVSMGLSLSSNYTPSIDAYISRFWKLFSKFNYMTNNQIKKVINEKGVNEKIIKELKENELINFNDFRDILYKFHEDIDDFWTDISVLSGASSNVYPNGKQDYSDVYRIYTMIMGMRVIADNYLPLIQEKYPEIYNRSNQIGNIFRKLWSFFKSEEIIDSSIEFNNFISYLTEPDKQVIILKNILTKGDNLKVPKNITKELWDLLPYLGLNLTTDEKTKEKIIGILQEYLYKEGSLKEFLINLIGQNDKNTEINEQKEKIDKIFNPDGEVTSSLLERIVDAIFENTTIDSELLDVISQIIYDLKLLNDFEDWIKGLDPRLSLFSPQEIKRSLQLIFETPNLKTLIKAFIIEQF